MKEQIIRQFESAEPLYLPEEFNIIEFGNDAVLFLEHIIIKRLPSNDLNGFPTCGRGKRRSLTDLWAMYHTKYPRKSIKRFMIDMRLARERQPLIGWKYCPIIERITFTAKVYDKDRSFDHLTEFGCDYGTLHKTLGIKK